MKVIQVRHVPDELHADLRRRAGEAGMSLSDYALEQLRRAAGRSGNAEVVMRAATRPGRVATADVLEAVRSGRAGR